MCGGRIVWNCLPLRGTRKTIAHIARPCIERVEVVRWKKKITFTYVRNYINANATTLAMGFVERRRVCCFQVAVAQHTIRPNIDCSIVVAAAAATASNAVKATKCSLQN